MTKSEKEQSKEVQQDTTKGSDNADPRKIELDYKVLNAMVQFKPTLNFVADYMGVSRDTIMRRIKSDYGMTYDEYKKMKAQRVGYNVAQKLYDEGMKGNITALIFLSKNFAGMTDKVEQTVEDKRTLNQIIADHAKKVNG